MIVTWIARVIASLNANRRPGEIAAGLATGVLLALLPAGNLLWVTLFVLTAFVKLNFGMELIAVAILSPLAPLLDPALHALGLRVLSAPGLAPVFAAVYSLPLMPFTRFNNTVVMGALIAGLAAWVPAFLLGRVLVRVYRTHLHPRLAESKIVKTFQRIPIVSRIAGLVRRFQRIYSVVS